MQRFWDSISVSGYVMENFVTWLILFNVRKLINYFLDLTIWAKIQQPIT